MEDFEKDLNEALEEDDDIVTLMSANGEEIDFTEIAGIAHKGNFYAILQPVELLDGMKDDEALVFKVTRDESGQDHFEIVIDEEICDAIFQEYNKLLDDVEKEKIKNNNNDDKD